MKQKQNKFLITPQCCPSRVVSPLLDTLSLKERVGRVVKQHLMDAIGVLTKLGYFRFTYEDLKVSSRETYNFLKDSMLPQEVPSLQESIPTLLKKIFSLCQKLVKAVELRLGKSEKAFSL